MWQPISTAPFDRDLELAVLDAEGPHTLVFPCRRILGGWTKAGPWNGSRCIPRTGGNGISRPEPASFWGCPQAPPILLPPRTANERALPASSRLFPRPTVCDNGRCWLGPRTCPWGHPFRGQIIRPIPDIAKLNRPPPICVASTQKRRNRSIFWILHGEIAHQRSSHFFPRSPENRIHGAELTERHRAADAIGRFGRHGRLPKRTMIGKTMLHIDMAQYRHNHYVPVWYQRRFMLPGQHRYYRLDLKPDVVESGKVKYTKSSLHHWGPDRIFAEDDLYTTQWGDISNTEIEQFFFGRLDREGSHAVEFFSTFDHTHFNEPAFKQLMTYMSVQKMRTPKGLAHFNATLKRTDKNAILLTMQQVHRMYCAIWTESIWQIANAIDSPTKFIISDHPVTVYNRACPPLSKWCIGHNDPDIWLHATHTYFPLSLDKVLILTNLSWVRNPYQNEVRTRPNPHLFRDAIFNFASVQTGRTLSEDEVLQLNYITKRRAYRYIAAADKQWLYPERHVSIDHWKKLGGGHLLMPEPRLVTMGGEIFLGYKGGGSDSFSEYGHKPWQKGYKDERREKRESEALYRFQAEWAIKHGAKYTANNSEFGGFRIREDSDEMINHHKALLQKYRKNQRR